MRTTRLAIAPDQRSFGRRAIPSPQNASTQTPLLNDDVRLFATTFAAGFLFVSLVIA